MGSAVREYDDELIIAIDAPSEDGTEKVAGRHADRVFVIEHPSGVEQPFDWVMRQASGGWILRLDDDELKSPESGQNISAILGDEEITHDNLHRRWVVSRARAATGGSASSPGMSIPPYDWSGTSTASTGIPPGGTPRCG